MGAIRRQVLQVKRKNSTNCSPPDARLTVVGSVAWRSGPREVTMGRAVATSLGAAWVAGSSVDAGRVAVRRASVGSSVTAARGVTVKDSGAHATNSTRIRPRLILSAVEVLRKNRVFIIFLRKRYSIKSLSKHYRLSLFDWEALTSSR